MAETMAITALMQMVFEKTTSLIPLIMGHFRGTWGADVHKEMMRLQSILSTIRSVLEDAEEQQLKNNTIKDWLAKLKDAAYDADDILDLFHWEFLRQEAESQDSMISKVRRFFSSENPILFRIRMRCRVKEIVERLDGVAAERSKFHLSTCGGCQHENDNRTETHSFVIESEVVGRRADKDYIVEMLISALDDRDRVSVLPIVGMGGLGKTTLAKIVYNDHRVKKHFQLLMWVCVSDKFDVRRLAQKVIESATRNVCHDSSMDLLQRKLREVLGSKRYLLVLDDVWNEDATRWQELRLLLSHGAQGSAVMVTTRSEIVSSIMRTMDTCMLAHLSCEDCWNVFKQRAFAHGAEEPPNLVKIGKKIVEKFGGLPLAAELVGSLMRFKKDEREWSSVLESEIWNLPPGENNILPVLRLSYDHLPSHLKECFAYCAIFPKDYILNKEFLIQLWMANGFIPCVGEMEIEDKGHEIFNELVARSFLQNVEVDEDPYLKNHFYHYMTTKNYKMHDLIHDLAQAITKGGCCILEDKELEGSQNVTVRHVSVDRKATMTIIDRAVCSFSKSMRTLLCDCAGSPVHLWLKAKSLRVLALPGVLLKEIPQYIDDLKHLRYLDLSGTDIEKVPEATCLLFHLQTLILENCRNLRELPKGMKDLKNLRHLYIGGCNKLTYMPIGMANLTCLQTLSMYVVGSATCSGNIGELRHLNIRGELALCGLNNVKTAADAKEASLCTKRDLLSLDLSWSCERNMENVEEVVEFLQPHQNIKWLRIKEYKGTNFPNWMMRCEVHLPNLVEVVLLNCSRCEHLPPLGQLRFLEVLSIEGLAGVKYLGHSQSNFYGSQGGNATELFHSLKVFRLIKMANLEEWVGMEVTGASTFFPRLTSLLICDCPKLRTVPHLPSIQVLKISVCPLLLPKKGFFMKMNFLNVLDIYECNKLTLMLTKEEVSGSSTFLGHLEYLAMRSCEELVSLSDEFMCHLSSLKILAIDHCKNLVGSLSSCSSSIEGRGLQLQHITTIERLRIRWCDKVVGNPLKLPGPCLRELTLFNCLNLQSLSLSGLNVLQFLSIRSCQNLESFPDGLGHLAALEELEIIDCPGLTTLPEWLGCLTNLRRLDVGSQTLVSLPQSLGYLPALRNLVFRYVTWTCLPDWLGGLTTLVELKVSGCSSLTSLPEGLGRLTQLEVLYIDDCPRLTSLPKDLQPQLPRLKWLIIVSSPKLARQCTPGGKYWHLISQIPSRAINLRSNTIENSWKYWAAWTEPQQHRSLQLLLQ